MNRQGEDEGRGESGRGKLRRARNAPQPLSPAQVYEMFLAITAFVSTYYPPGGTAVMFVSGFASLGDECSVVVEGRRGQRLAPIKLIANEQRRYRIQWAKLPKELALNKWLVLMRLPIPEDLPDNPLLPW